MFVFCALNVSHLFLLAQIKIDPMETDVRLICYQCLQKFCYKILTKTKEGLS